MTTLSKHIIRLACDPISREPVVDKYTDERPFIRSGEDVEFQIGLFNRGSLADTTDITSLVLEVRAGASAPSYLFQTTVTSLSSLSVSTWLDDTAQHATFALPAASNTFTEGGYNILIYAYTATTRFVVLSTSIDVLQTVLGGTAPTPTSSFYTKAEVDSLVSGAGFDSPLTTKGDILTYSTTEARLPVGIAGRLLSVDLTTATGLTWTQTLPYVTSTFYPKLYGVTSTTEVTSPYTLTWSLLSRTGAVGMALINGVCSFNTSSGFSSSDALRITNLPFIPAGNFMLSKCTSEYYQNIVLESTTYAYFSIAKISRGSPTGLTFGDLYNTTSTWGFSINAVIPVQGLS